MTKNLHTKFSKSAENSNNTPEEREDSETEKNLIFDFKEPEKEKEEKSNQIKKSLSNEVTSSVEKGTPSPIQKKLSATSQAKNEDRIIRKVVKQNPTFDSHAFRKAIFSKKISKEFFKQQLFHIYKGLNFSKIHLIPKKNYYMEKQVVTLEDNKSKIGIYLETGSKLCSLIWMKRLFILATKEKRRIMS